MRNKLTFGAAVLALAMTGQPASAAPQAESLATEARLAAKHPGLFTRSGKTLRIGGNSFTDTGDCNYDGDCVFYRVDSVFNGYIGVWTNYYETSEYLLVDPRGESTTVGDRPVISPSGKHFFVLYEDPHDWNPLQGAAIWNWAELHRLRLVDQALAEVQRFVAWRGDYCVELEGRRRYPDPYQPMWLAEQDGDWRLTTTRPLTCKD